MELAHAKASETTNTSRKWRATPPVRGASHGKDATSASNGIANEQTTSDGENGKRQGILSSISIEHSQPRSSTQAGERVEQRQSPPRNTTGVVPLQRYPRIGRELQLEQARNGTERVPLQRYPRIGREPQREQPRPQLDRGGSNRQPTSRAPERAARSANSSPRSAGTNRQTQPLARESEGGQQTYSASVADNGLETGHASPQRNRTAGLQIQPSTRTARLGSQRQLSSSSAMVAPGEKAGICLLSLDGGGVRGLSSLLILQRVMERMNEERRRLDLAYQKPCEVFDMIGGTSTGGLIAIMLGRLEMDVSECIKEYISMFETIFGRKKRLPFNFCGGVQSQFDSGNLKFAVEKLVRRKLGDVSQDFRRPIPPESCNGLKCRTFVCATSRELSTLAILRDYHSSGADNSINPTIVDAALATSAAPTFFDPVTIGGRQYVDGGLGANNPVDSVWTEAQNIWSRADGDLKPLLKCFISVGTGKPSTAAVGGHALGLVKALQTIATDNETTARSFAKRHRSLLNRRYFRFNVEQGLQGTALHEYKNAPTIVAATGNYLDEQELQKRLDVCADVLKMKESSTPIGFAAEVTAHKARFQAYAARATPSLSSRAPPPSMAPPPRPPHFVGRDDTMSKLDRLMDHRDGCRRIVLYGLGGVGKSRIALEALYRRKERVSHTIQILWFNVGTLQRLGQNSEQIAESVDVEAQESQQDGLTLIKDWLGGNITDECILVLDGADDSNPLSNETLAANFFPGSTSGTILLTTRNKEVGVKFGQWAENLVQVPAFHEYESILLLKDRVGSRFPQTDYGQLADALEHFPLALVQSAAFMNERGVTPAGYLKLFEGSNDAKIKLLSKNFEEELRHKDAKNPVATTFAVSFEHISKKNPSAARILALMSMFNAYQVPVNLLRSGNKDDIAFSEALGPLKAFSLINSTSTDGQGPEAYDMHRLVRLSMHGWLERSGEFEATLENAIRILNTKWPNTIAGNLVGCWSHFPHMISLISLHAKCDPTPYTPISPENPRNIVRHIVHRWCRYLAMLLLPIKTEHSLWGNTVIGLAILENIARCYDEQGHSVLRSSCRKGTSTAETTRAKSVLARPTLPDPQQPSAVGTQPVGPHRLGTPTDKAVKTQRQAPVQVKGLVKALPPRRPRPANAGAAATSSK